MTRRASAPTIILIVLIIISLAAAGGGFYLFQKERTKSLELEEKLDEINTKQRITENRLKESEKLISDLQLKLQESKFQIDDLNNGLKQEKQAREEALGKLEVLRTDLEEQKKLRFDLEKKFNQAQEDARRTQSQLKDLESQKADLETKIKDLESKSKDVELGKIVVSPEASAAKKSKDKKEKAAKPASEVKAKAKSDTKAKEQPKSKVKTTVVAGPEGKVLTINNEYDFLVINLGSRDGIKLGDVFSVFHDTKYLGDVKIEKLHDAMAAAGFISENLKGKVSEGDKVVQKVK